MDDHRNEGPGATGGPIPRDLPDQQAHDGEDPWEVGAGGAQGDTVDATGTADADASESEESEESDADVPDTDEKPVLDEPSG